VAQQGCEEYSYLHGALSPHTDTRRFSEVSLHPIRKLKRTTRAAKSTSLIG
jgi:hypothetical protein